MTPPNMGVVVIHSLVVSIVLCPKNNLLSEHEGEIDLNWIGKDTRYEIRRARVHFYIF